MTGSLASARALRDPILADGATDACRLADGAADGMPGLEVDSFAGRLLVSTRRGDIPGPLLAELRAAAAPVYHKQLDPNERTSPAHLAGPPQSGAFLIREHGVRFEVSFEAGYSQGIFLDQRDNRLRLRRRVGNGDTVLNTFAYTGAFSVVAALGGATTTTLDLSQPYLDWARRNFACNRLDPDAHYFCRGDTFHWLRRFARQGRRFDVIVLDPPTFSRDARGRVFRVESDYRNLVELALACLAAGGRLLCCTNCRGLDGAGFEREVRAGIDRPARLESAPMPADFRDAPYLKSIWVSA